MRVYASCVARTRAALDARLAGAPGGEILREYFERGKMLRAYLVFAAAEAVGGETADVAIVAAAIELLHAASLFHDDIIDEAPHRRGVPALQMRLGIGPALVVGDELLLSALAALAEMRDRHPPDRVLQAMGELVQLGRHCCRGQYEELHAGPWSDEEQYLSIVRGKTAAPFVAAGMLGAVFGGGTDAQIDGIRSYANHLGIAFQIADDILDLVGDSEDLGKPAGNSLAHQRPLLPLIYLWRHGTDAVRAQLRELAARGWPRQPVVALLEKHRTFDLVRETHRRHVQQALDALEGAALPVAAGVDALRELATGIATLA